MGLLVANRRGADAIVVVTTAGGPLTREEPDLLQGGCDPLTLSRFLPRTPLQVGDRWELGQDIARAVSEYEQIKANTLRGRLAALDEKAARIEITGEIKGTVRGAEGSVLATGELIFDRVARRVRRLRLERQESRNQATSSRPSTSKALWKSPVKVSKSPPSWPTPPSPTSHSTQTQPANFLSSAAPAASRACCTTELHVTSSEGGRIVLRRVEGPNLVARFDLVAGPTVAPGRHQDPDQFRIDVEAARTWVN